MLAYIKDQKTFETKHKATAKYDMTLQSIYDEVTSIYLPGTERNVVKGDFIYCDGYLGIIVEIDDTEKDMLTLTCHDIVTLFRRDLLPTTDSSATGIEGFIRRQIMQNYVNVADTVYRLPFINVSTITTTPSDVTPTIEDGVWNIKSFIAKVRRTYGVFTDVAMAGKNTLNITIQKMEPPKHNIDLSTSGFEVLEEATNIESIGKITAFAEDTGKTTNWYLLQDGTITQAYTASNRVDGRWATLIVDEAINVEQEVRNRFAENSYSHIIEFATHKQYGFYDGCVLRTRKGKVLQSYISAVRKKSDDDRIIYKTGELRTTLDQKLNLIFGGK